MKETLTQKEISFINEVLLPEDIPSAKAEVALVLGFGPFSGYLADRAAALYFKGQVERIVVAGGVPMMKTDFADTLMSYAVKAGQPAPLDEKETEAEYMKRCLLSKRAGTEGIPEAIMTTENASENLSQNMKFSKPMLENATSIILVVGAGCTRRAIDTARTPEIWPWPESRTVLATDTVYPLDLTKENWPNNPLAIGYMRGELNKLVGQDNYYDKGFCVHADWDLERRLVSTLTRSPSPIAKRNNPVNHL